jgi:alpha-tubulin suppressor-like RCC1 family protein
MLSNSTVVAWGDNTYGQTNVPAGLSNVVAIAAGDFHSYALLTNGTISRWGDDSYGQLDAPLNLTNVIAVASGNYHGLALTPVVYSLQSAVVSAQLVLRWTGPAVLQWAPSVSGPFSDLQTIGRSYTNLDLSQPMKFFRTRH